MSQVSKGRWIPEKFWVPAFGSHGGDWEGGYCWNCDSCGKEFVSRRTALEHWRKQHRELVDGLPRFVLLKTIRVKGTSGLEKDITFQVCGNCGKNLRHFWAIIRDRQTGEEIVLGSECVKSYTGEPFDLLHRDFKKFQADENQAWEDWYASERLRDKVREFEEVNSDIVAHLEKRIAEEKKLYDEKVAAMKTAAGAIAANGRFPVYRGELWESLLQQVKERGSLSQKQLDLVTQDMTRNRHVSLVVGQKVTISGRITSARYEASEYGQFARLTVRSNDGVDYIIKTKADTQKDRRGSKFARAWKILLDEYEGKVVEYPESLTATGTIKWVDPLGGRAVLIRPK